MKLIIIGAGAAAAMQDEEGVGEGVARLDVDDVEGAQEGDERGVVRLRKKHPQFEFAAVKKFY